MFDKHYSLFGNDFNNVSTNPSKYNPQKQSYDFNLDFSLVKKQNPTRRYQDNSLDRDQTTDMYSGDNGYFTQR